MRTPVRFLQVRLHFPDYSARSSSPSALPPPPPPFLPFFLSPGDYAGNDQVALLAFSSHTPRLKSRRLGPVDVRNPLWGQRMAAPPSRQRMPPTTFLSILCGPSQDLQGSAPITALTRTPSASSPWQPRFRRGAPLGYLLSCGEKRSARGFLGIVVGRVLRVCKHSITGPRWD